MINSISGLRKTFAPVLLLSCALAFSFLTAGAATQTRSRSNRQRRSKPATAVKASASPTPIAVPRLPPNPARRANTPATVPSVADGPTVTMADDDAPPPPRVPKPSPTPAAADEVIETDEEVVRVTSNLVVVPTSVTDAAGEPVQGLQVADFRLEEEGRAQEIAQIAAAEQVPLDIAILFDVSSSVTENFEFQKQAAAGFLKQVLKTADRAAVFTIAEKPRMEFSFTSAEGATRNLLALRAADKPTGTAFFDTVAAATKYLAENSMGQHRRVVLVISDGEDNFSDRIRASAIEEYEAVVKAETPAQKQAMRDARRSRQDALYRKALQEVMRDVQRADVVFYSINPSGPSIRLNEISTRAQNNMQQLADATGGSSFVPEKISDLDAVFRRIAAELRAQYLLQYYSNSQAPPGKYLGIKVRAPARSELRVRARQGYYVPKPK